jgi:site-specific recombinase XerD
MVRSTRGTSPTPQSKTAARWRKGVEQLTLTDLAHLFEFHNRTEGKSGRTIGWYNEVLGRFASFLEREGTSLLIDNIGEPEVRAFIAYLQAKYKWVGDDDPPVRTERLSGEGIQNRVRALKAFFNWLHREGYTAEYRLQHLRNLRTQQKVEDILTEEEIARVLATCDVRTHWGARDHAMLTLLLDTGLRMSELIGLKLRDVDVEAGALKVLGKGNKERMVPFGAAAQKTVWRYVQHVRPDPVGTDCLFLTLEGAPFTPDGFRSLIKRVGPRAGVARLHPHLCRHTFATRYLMNGGDVFSLQQILGHTTLEMVRRYVRLASAHVAVQHRKFSPMDRVAVSPSRRVRPERGRQPNQFTKPVVGTALARPSLQITAVPRRRSS